MYSYMKKCPSRKHPSPWLSSWMFGLQWKCFLYLISCLQSKLNFVWSYFSGSCPYIWIYGWRTCLDVLYYFQQLFFLASSVYICTMQKNPCYAILLFYCLIQWWMMVWRKGRDLVCYVSYSSVWCHSPCYQMLFYDAGTQV